MKPEAESLTVAERCWQEDIFFNIGVDVNGWWRSTLAKERAVCGLSGLIGVSNVLTEMRVGCWGDPMDHTVDASTCKSILFRRGRGGIKDLDTKQLWVQEAITEKRIRALKINRGEPHRHIGVDVRMMGCDVGGRSTCCRCRCRYSVCLLKHFLGLRLRLTRDTNLADGAARWTAPTGALNPGVVRVALDCV